jgi:hypothetical protein
VSSPRLLRQEIEDYENKVKKHKRLLAAYNKKVEAYNKAVNAYNDNVMKDEKGDPVYFHGTGSVIWQWSNGEPVINVSTMYKSGDSWYVKRPIIGVTYPLNEDYGTYPLFATPVSTTIEEFISWELVERIDTYTVIIRRLKEPYQEAPKPEEFDETAPAFKLKPPDFTAAQLKKLYKPSSALELAASMRISGGFIDAVLSYKPKATISKTATVGSDFSFGGEGEGDD